MQYVTTVIMLTSRIRHQPILQLLSGAFMISFSAVFVKIAGVSPTASAFYRVFFGAIVLLAAALWPQTTPKKLPGHWWLLVLCGFLFALDLFFWHEAILYVGPGLATILGNFQVFLLTGIGIVFLGDKIRPGFILSVPLAVAGLSLIVGWNWSTLDSDYRIGLYFGLLTAICYAAFLLCLRRVQTDSINALIWSLCAISACCAFFLGLKMIYAGDSFIIPNLNSLFTLVSLGLFCQSIGWVIIAKALPAIRPGLAGLLLLLQPTLAFIWDVLMFSRETTALNWAGVMLTLTAIYLGARPQRAQP